MKEIREHRIQVPRSARYYTVGSPTEEVTDLWYACHGYGELAAKFVRNFEVIGQAGRLVVAPEALMRYYTNHQERMVGATWMTSEDRLVDIEDYVRYLDLLHEQVMATMPNQPSRVRVLGFSQGAATATRWAVRGKLEGADLILWGSSIPPDLDPDADLERLRACSLTFVMGERDEFASNDAIEREKERLARLGLSYELMTFDGGHRMDDDTLVKIASAH